MTSKELKNTLAEYGINIFLIITTMLIFILLGYIASGLIDNTILRDTIKVVFPIFGLFLQFMELRYEYLKGNK